MRYLLPILLLACYGVQAAEDDKIATDRPDFVESSVVVGKGRLQIETSAAIERLRAEGGRERTVSTPTLLRYGISDAFELRLETDGRVLARSEEMAGARTVTRRGYADSSLGVKWHLRDPKDGAPSVGLLAHLDLPSGSAALRGNGPRPSLRISAEWELPGELGLGVMPGLARQRGDDGGHFTSGIFGMVIGKNWTDNLRTYMEVALPQIAPARDGGSQAGAGIGAGYIVNNHWQIDTGLLHGLNKRTPDLSWTIGLSVKL